MGNVHDGRVLAWALCQHWLSAGPATAEAAWWCSRLPTAAATCPWFCRNRRGRRVVLEVAKALNFLHARGVVHMDVKSNNVLLTSVGGDSVAECVCVGIAWPQPWGLSGGT